MSNQSLQDNDFNGDENLDGESAAPDRLALANPALAIRHQRADPELGITKWEKEINKVLQNIG